MTPAMAPPPGEGRPTITMDAGELAALAQMLTQVDEFLRTGDHVAHHLADYLSTGPGDTGQTAACCLIDIFSFTACGLSRKADDALAAQQAPNTVQGTDEQAE